MYPRLIVESRKGLKFIKVDQIVYCQADGNYTKIFLECGDHVLATKKLKEIEAILDESIFYRIHHSHIINLNFLASLKNETGLQIILTDGKELEVSKRKKSDFMNLFKKI